MDLSALVTNKCLLLSPHAAFTLARTWACAPTTYLQQATMVNLESFCRWLKSFSGPVLTLFKLFKNLQSTMKGIGYRRYAWMNLASNICFFLWQSASGIYNNWWGNRLNTLADGRFSPSNQQFVHVFAQKQLWCQKCWRAVQTLKTLGKSSIMQWKKLLLLFCFFVSDVLSGVGSGLFI